VGGVVTGGGGGEGERQQDKQTGRAVESHQGAGLAKGEVGVN